MTLVTVASHFACDNFLVADDDLRTFIRDITRRNELVWRGVMDELRELREVGRQHTAEIRQLSREIRDMREETRDMRAETIAQRDGLFKLIDKINELGNGPDPGPAPA